MECISRTGKSISEIIEPYNKYFNTGEINTKVGDKEEVQNKIALIKQRYGDGQINEMDGLSISYPDVWFIVRGSNTEPMLRLIVESADKARMEQVRDEVLGIIRG
jgi:phosphomannomutase